MTPKEAIKLLRAAMPDESDEEMTRAFRLAIEALERSIPKKPKSDFSVMTGFIHFCPNCEGRFGIGATYCPDCGQRISKRQLSLWEDIDED